MRISPFIAMPAVATVVLPLALAAPAGAGSDDAARVVACKGRQLHTSLGEVGAAAGSYYQRVKFRNSGERCELRTWPEVGYANRRGIQVGHFAAHRSKLPHRVVLAPGQRSRVMLQTPNPGNFPRKECGPARASKIVTYVPGRITGNARHVDRLKNPFKVCTTKRGRPHLLQRFG